MDLTRFLLARIAEDEEPTFKLVPYECDPGCCAPAGWVGHRCLICGTPAEYGGAVAAITDIAREHEEQVHQRSRTLAECEAKRRIVEALGDYGDGHIWASGEASRAEDALMALALPYADHPDYRAGWKP